MEFVIILAILGGYFSLSSRLDKLINNQTKDFKNKFPSLNELIGKNINIETNDQLDLVFGSATKGILKEFNEKWIVIEVMSKKNKKELFYYRLNNIVSIDVIED